MEVPITNLSYRERLDILRQRKLAYTRDKQQVIGSMDYDDWGLILPPPDERILIDVMGPSGIPIKDVHLNGIEMLSNHPSGSYFGPQSVGENYRRLLQRHPVFVDPVSSLAGAYMTNFGSYQPVNWPPEFDYSHLHDDQKKYQLDTGIGGRQHFSQDLTIGLQLGWGGLLDKIAHYRTVNPDSSAFYDGLEAVILGVQDWIRRHADAAREMAEDEPDSQQRQNLETIADINERLVADAPQTFREACQWILWYQLIARMYNGSGSLGRLDVVLQPFYEADTTTGTLTDDEAMFHIACILLRDTAYIQLGGPDAAGRDVTSPLSFLILEAAHQLRIPTNIGIAVGKDVDPALLQRGVEIIMEDKLGHPKFLGVDQTAADFTRLGYPIEDGRERVYTGCHWLSIPGREYTMDDMIKVVLPVVFDIALRDMLSDTTVEPDIDTLWQFYDRHLTHAVAVIAEGIDFHIEHMHRVFPELVLDLLCHGPIEKGLDASQPAGVDYINIGIDGSGLANVADSFAAIEQRIENEKRMTWADLLAHLDADWAGVDGNRARLMMKAVPHYGHGGARADDYARRIAQHFAEKVIEQRTPAGHRMVPGLFSWAKMLKSGRKLGATPDGRYAGEPISQGANPSPGFRKDGAPTALAAAVASVQPGYGNTAPMQIEFEPMLARETGGVELVKNLITTHFDLGGSQINMNILDREKILAANENPDLYPDLIVRVTGFSAYFASLSPEFRQLVVNRILQEM